MSLIKRRKALQTLTGAPLLYLLTACGARKLFKNNKIELSVVLYSYVNRPIFDVLLNGSDIGLASGNGRGGIMTGEMIPFGPQTLTWRLGGPKGAPRNGETVVVKNSLLISRDQVPPGSRYLGVHIYPDDTAELTVSEYIPERSIRGEKILASAQKHDH